MSKVRCLLAAALLLTLLWGCSKDCPVCPVDEDQPETPAYKGWLYYVEDRYNFADLYMVDMETDSIVDSLLPLPEPHTGPTGAMAVSSDGRYLAIGYADYNSDPLVRPWWTRVFDAQTLEPITEIADALPLQFDGHDQLLILLGGRADRIIAYQIPSFTLIFEESLPMEFYGDWLDDEDKLIYCSGDDLHLYTYDYANRRLADSIHIVPWSGDTCTVYQFCLNQDFTRIYYRGGASHGSHVGCYDIDSQQVLWTQPTGGFWGTVGVTPDEGDVYVSDYSADTWESNSIYVFDANSGAYRNGISLYGYTQWPRLPLEATDIIFSPTGEKAYVTVISAEMSYGSVMVIDTKLRRVVKVITPEMDRWPQFMAIGPKL